MTGFSGPRRIATYSSKRYGLVDEHPWVGGYHFSADPGWHRHEFHELAYLSEGEVIHHGPDGRRKIGAGDLVHVSPGVPHWYEVKSPVVLFNCLFTSPCLEKVLEAQDRKGRGLRVFLVAAPGYRIESLPLAERPFVRDLFARAEEECLLRRDRYGASLRAILGLLLVDLFRAGRPNEEASSKLPDLVARGLRFLDSHFHEPSAATRAREVLGVSESHFAKTFKAATGKSVNRFVTERRVKLASDLIRDGAFSHLDVCFKAGFESYSSYFRAFKQIHGMTPSEFEDSIRSGG